MRRADHENEFAARFQRIRVARQFSDRRALDLFVQFCEFAADRGVAGAHDGREIGEGVLHAVAGFEHDQGGIDLREFSQPGAARAFFRRQKSLEEKPVGRQRRNRQR